MGTDALADHAGVSGGEIHYYGLLDEIGRLAKFAGLYCLTH
jgi:hypothetical protein